MRRFRGKVMRGDSEPKARVLRWWEKDRAELMADFGSQARVVKVLLEQERSTAAGSGVRETVERRLVLIEQVLEAWPPVS
ncbi:MAG TPA: hypothetical protein VJA25_02545 [Dehalococcoidia bacterium]|nr:hypothetical protein [Dehalococcoidia bacterium]